MDEPQEVEQLPQTPTIHEKPPLEFDQHTWLQVGSFIEHRCGDGCSFPGQGIPVPQGKMLSKEGGRYTLIDEVR